MSHRYIVTKGTMIDGRLARRDSRRISSYAEQHGIAVGVLQCIIDDIQVRGGQYEGNEYHSLRRRSEVWQGMSRPDNCYDNAFMESGFGTIKNELEMTDYESQGEAKGRDVKSHRLLRSRMQKLQARLQSEQITKLSKYETQVL